MATLGQILLTLRLAGVTLALVGFGLFLILRHQDWGMGGLCITLGLFLGAVSWYWTHHRQTQQWWVPFEEALPTMGFHLLDAAEADRLRGALPAILPEALPGAKPLKVWSRDAPFGTMDCGSAATSGDGLVTCIFVLVTLPTAYPFRVELRSRRLPRSEEPWLKAYRIIQQTDDRWDLIVPTEAHPLLRELACFDWNLHGGWLCGRFIGPLPGEVLDAAKARDLLSAWMSLPQMLLVP